MPIAITDEHQELAATVWGVLTTHHALAANRALLEADDEPRPSFWPEMADLEWLGVHLPEDTGGGGGTLNELVVILEALGRQVAPGPFLPTALASAVIARCGTPEQQQALLPGLADGSVTAASGSAGRSRWTGRTLDGDGGIVLGGKAADLLLLAAGPDIVVVRRNAEGLALGGAKDIDPSRRSATVTVASVTLAEEDVLVGAVRRARALARTLGAAEAAGVMAACTEAAVAYAKVRVQFGRTIGTFQAVKHHCADMLVATELAIASVWEAARASGDTLDEFELTAAMAAHLAFAPGRAQRADEHPGARRHRVHLGARRPPLPPPGPRAQLGARLAGRRRGRHRAGRAGHHA